MISSALEDGTAKPHVVQVKLSQANFANLASVQLRSKMIRDQVLHFRWLAAIMPAKGDGAGGLSFTGGSYIQIPDASLAGDRQVFLLNGFLKHSGQATVLDRMKNVFNGSIFALVTLVSLQFRPCPCSSDVRCFRCRGLWWTRGVLTTFRPKLRRSS